MSTTRPLAAMTLNSARAVEVALGVERRRDQRPSMTP
jgi:hypothetical protein